MSLVRAFALCLLAPVGVLACSQDEGSVLLFDEADASADKAAEHLASPSTAASEVVARLDSYLAKMPNAPLPDPSMAPEPRDVEPMRPIVRLRPEGAFLQVDAEAHPQTRRARVALPLRARDAFRIVDESTGIEAYVSLKNASEAEAEIVDGQVVYRRGISGQADVVHRPSALGTEDFILFDEAPPRERLEYEVALGKQVAGLRLVENVLELLDEGGAPRLRVAPPYVIDAEGERHDAALSVEGCAVDTNPAAPWGREPVAAGASTCTVVVDWREQGVRYPAVVDPSWETTGSMATLRANHTASLLSTGRVLVAGGRTASSTYLKSSELYDPASGTWSSTGSMSELRSDHTATILDSGRVLVAGGRYFSNTTGWGGTNYYWRSAEIYAADTGQWSSTGSMNTGRALHGAVRLEDGAVLVAGGHNLYDSFSSAELYDPVAGSFTSIGTMTSRREGHQIVRLSDGKVLIVGGSNRTTDPDSWLSSAEIFDPNGRSFSSIGNISGARADHGAALLLDGRVFVYGGRNGSGYVETGAIYDPASQSWTPVPPSIARATFSVTVLTNGQILVAGGRNGNGWLRSAEIYDPAGNTWQPAGSMSRARAIHSATRLFSGDVLIAGGYDGSSFLSSSELYQSPSLTCTVSSDCPSGPCVDGYCCDSECNGACGRCDLPGFEGACRPVAAGSSGSPSCSPYVCSGTNTACPTSCTNDADCVPSHVCSSGNCKPKAPNGSACSAPIECQSGVCKEGVCCDRACDGNCESCTSGKCGFAVAGTPKAGCGYFVCNGQSGTCPVSCSNDAQCRSDAFCDGGICQPKAANGTACQKGGDCKSGFCVDGVCCESACDGQCAQCNREGALGSCVPVTGEPVGGRAPCTNDGSICGGSCDGQSLDCSYPSAGGICAGPSCVDGVASDEARCDGEGRCAPSEPRHCAPYACGDIDCKAVCVDSRDCHPSADCVQTHCMGTLEIGDSCVADGECKSGHCANGVCCSTACDEPCAACNVAGLIGTCIAGGDTSEECRGNEAALGDWALQEPTGCGCRVAGETTTGGSHAALGGLGLVLAWAFRRRGSGKGISG